MILLGTCRDYGLFILSKLSWIPPFLTRLILASIFIVSGWGKMHNIQKVIGFFTDLGIPYPHFHAYSVAFLEFSCGVAILVGFFTRLATLPLCMIMSVAILTAQKNDIHGITDFLDLPEFLYIVLCLWIMLVGPGKLSVDNYLMPKFLSKTDILNL